LQPELLPSDLIQSGAVLKKLFLERPHHAGRPTHIDGALSQGTPRVDVLGAELRIAIRSHQVEVQRRVFPRCSLDLIDKYGAGLGGYALVEIGVVVEGSITSVNPADERCDADAGRDPYLAHEPQAVIECA
jgi:hypothetical protein